MQIFKTPAPATDMSVLKAVAKAPIQAYRWTLKAFVGWHCRHMPTCSEFGLEAIEKNGPWRGWWQTR